MNDYGLVLNAGSSSLKFSVYSRTDSSSWRVEARGLVEGLGSSPAFSAKDGAGSILEDRALPATVKDAGSAIETLAGWLRARFGGARVLGVGHRVVHGGPRFAGPVLVTPAVVDELRTLVPLAPLHQPFNIAAIEAVSTRIPDVPQVACFDTSFHRGRSAMTSVVPLPRAICGDRIQRYGFHGLSYEYIASVLPDVAPEIANGRVIVAHLGSGASLCAMSHRKSIDTTLGFTALDGLCMGTRPGAVDPGVILYLFQTLGLTAKDVERMLYKESGLIGISGISNDMRELLKSAAPAARLAVDYFVYRIVREIGGLAAVLGGLDGVVFTAGIGERSAEIRARIADGCRWLGIDLDEAANARHATRITKQGARASAWVIPTDEELMIARQTGALLGLAAVRA